MYHIIETCEWPGDKAIEISTALLLFLLLHGGFLFCMYHIIETCEWPGDEASTIEISTALLLILLLHGGVHMVVYCVNWGDQARGYPFEIDKPCTAEPRTHTCCGGACTWLCSSVNWGEAVPLSQTRMSCICFLFYSCFKLNKSAVF